MELMLSERAAAYLKRLASERGITEQKCLEQLVLVEGAYYGPFASAKEAQSCSRTKEPRKWPDEK